MKLFRFTAMLILGLTVFLTVVILSVPYDGEGVPSAPDEPQPGSSEPSSGEQTELRAAWLSFFELTELFQDADQQEFEARFEQIAAQAAAYGLNALIVQVRPYADAVYPSAVYPWSHIITGTQGRDPGYDPLQSMVGLCHRYNLQIHARINPYRVKGKNNMELSADNQALKWYNDMDNEYVVNVDGSLYFNPAAEPVKQLILDGVAELVDQYDIDGIHMDDYFYPSAEEGYDGDSYAAYLAAGGTEDLSSFRRENVNDLVQRIYRLVKEKNPDVQFGISPGGNIEKNYNEQFADVALWLSEDGYVDYVMPQIYFGFEHGSLPFDDTADRWAQLLQAPGVKLYAGLPAYKIGESDQYAGSGAEEWKHSTENLKKMVQHLRANGNYSGFALYSFTSLFRPEEAVSAQVLLEREALRSLLD